MSNILDNPNCAEKIGNVGTPSCAISLDHIAGLILTEDSFEITNAQLATWALTLAALKTATLAPIGQRIYPLHDIIDLTDNTPAPESKTSGYGVTTKIVEKPHSFEIGYKDLGSKFFANLRNWKDRKDLRVYIIDPNFIGGEQTSTGLRGFKCTFMPKQIKIGNVADITKYPIQLDLTDPTCLTDKLSAITIPEDVTLSTELMGVLDVVLTTRKMSSGIIAVMATTAISKTNLYDEYSALLNDLDAWVFTTSAGVAFTPSAVGLIPETKEWSFSVPNAIYNVSLETASALSTLGIGGNGTSGFESGVISDTAV